MPRPFLAALLALTACAHAMPPAAPPVATRESRPYAGVAALEREVFLLVNRHRAARGLPALALDARISREARRHSAAMATGARPVGHRGFDDRVAALRSMMTFRRSAENVALNRGYSRPAAEAIRGWLASPPHRESLEGPYDATGVGVARNGAGEVYVTQLFVGR